MYIHKNKPHHLDFCQTISTLPIGAVFSRTGVYGAEDLDSPARIIWLLPAYSSCFLLSNRAEILWGRCIEGRRVLSSRASPHSRIL